MADDKIKVLIVDDSAVVRQSLTDIFNSDPRIEVMDVAPDPIVAAKRIEKQVPDVISLDIEMPRMDGITFLRKIMTQHPIPTVICSTLTEEGAEETIKALQYGAVDIILKPKLGTRKFFEESRIRICDSIKAAARVDVKNRVLSKKSLEGLEKNSADVMLPPVPKTVTSQTTERVVAIGASTGGTEALTLLLSSLPVNCPGIVIVQHMPEGFTRAFADRMNSLCQITVKEAQNGDSVMPGQALVAPGDKHILLKRYGARYSVEIKEGPLVSRHRPSVDVLFRSTARYAGKNAKGVILTGMGDDGARGMLEMRNAGAFTIAQNEETCVVYGMPQEAVRLEGVNKILPLQNIAEEILKP